MTPLVPNAADTYRFLRAISSREPSSYRGPMSDIRELRILQRESTGVIAGRFDNMAALARTARDLDSPDATGYYYTLNTLAPHPKIPVQNGVWTNVRRTANDSEVPLRNLILIDADPIRAEGFNGEPATNEEKAEAFVVADRAQAFLTSHGWPEPIRVDSGNGVHLNDGFANNNCGEYNGDRDLRSVLHVVADACDTELCKVDRSVFNASRICRLPGTVNRKGTPTEDRPWRLAKVISIPNPLIRVTTVNYAKLRNLVPPAPKLAMRKAGVDEDGIWELIEEYPDHFDCSGVRQKDGVKYFDLESCPFNDGPHNNHTSRKTCLILGDTFGFQCFADQCCDYTGQDLIELLYEETGEYPSMELYKPQEEVLDDHVIPIDWDDL